MSAIPAPMPPLSGARAPADGDHAPERFEELLLPLLPNAYRTARYFTRDPLEAEELVQEAAFQACRGFHGFRAGTCFRAWFMRILANAFFARRRREKHQVLTTPVEHVPDRFLYQRSVELGHRTGEGNPLNALLRRLDGDRVIEAIDALPPEFREVAGLYFVEEYSYQELAEILGCPIGTIRSRIHRARAALKRSLWSLVAEPGGSAG